MLKKSIGLVLIDVKYVVVDIEVEIEICNKCVKVVVVLILFYKCLK